jgi:hypothetical protein
MHEKKKNHMVLKGEELCYLPFYAQLLLRKLVRSNIYFNVLMTRIFILTLLPTQIIFSFLWCTDSPNAAFSHKREFLFEKKNLHSSSPFKLGT